MSHQHPNHISCQAAGHNSSSVELSDIPKVFTCMGETPCDLACLLDLDIHFKFDGKYLIDWALFMVLCTLVMASTWMDIV